MKATKQFKGVKDGEIYPTLFEVGDEIPAELEAAAIELGAVEQKKAVAGTDKAKS
ncbi:hypothetical protein [Delftia tsuruhatensis]|uniref:hypothetical protein n=1 Tax=Delftia tsuruhatensis TaxID=180282 RepID=UPI00289B402B|nr:hypothetical protein [Delftia tsuruhatensis]